MDFNDKELLRLLNIEVNVVVDIPPSIDHGLTEFNLKEVLDYTLN